MKILFVSEKFPYPLDTGGKIRTYHIIKGLSQEHEISLITTIDAEEQQRDIPELEKICREVRGINAAEETPLQLGIKILKNLFSPVPIVVERHYVPEVTDEIQRQIKHTNFDVVHFDHLDASFYLPYIPDTMTTVLDEHNIVSNQVKTSAEAEPNLFKKLYMMFQLKKTIRYESDICPKMTRCLVCSDADKAYLLKMARKTKVVTIPNGVDVDYFSDTSSQDRQGTNAVIFVGTLDYGPGAIAVQYFCEEILPLIQKGISNFHFYAVGQNPPGYLRKLAERDKHITLTGRVDDIRPYVAKADVFVVPLKSGSGTRLKILDAMAMGIPIVSTSIGAEGLEVCSGEHLLIADTSEAFSSAVLQLLQDDSLRETVRENAFQLVRGKYSWGKIWIDLLKVYKDLGKLS